MISKLLAEAVLDQQGRISTAQDSGNEVAFYGKESEFLGTYNIYELAHKCKEWAFYNGGYEVSSLFRDYGGQIGVASITQGTYKILFSDHEYTEPEAIFKACQWILDSND